MVIVDGGDVGLAAQELHAWKTPLLWEAMQEMGYEVVALGTRDVTPETKEWLAARNGTAPAFLIGNVKDAGKLASHTVVLERNGVRIGFVAGLSIQSLSSFREHGAVPLDEYLDARLKELKEAQVDYKVLLFHGATFEARKLAQERKDFDLIFVCRNAGRPMHSTIQPELVPMVGPGDRGREVALVKLGKIDGETQVSCDVIPLSDEVPASGKADKYIKKAAEIARQRAASGH